MKKKILDYLSDQIMQHNDLRILFYKKYQRSTKVQHKNKHYVDYKKHQEAARVLSKTAAVVDTIGKMEQERKK